MDGRQIVEQRLGQGADIMRLIILADGMRGQLKTKA
jgi:hypothetical protein